MVRHSEDVKAGYVAKLSYHSLIRGLWKDSKAMSIVYAMHQEVHDENENP